MRSVPVGMFHHVNHNADDFITVSVKHFADQMACLVKEGVTTLSAQELLAHQLGQKEAPAKSFAITFDDAWLDVYVHAFPILKQHGLKFTIFVVTDWSETASQNPPATLPFDFPTHHDSEKLVRANRTGEVICGWNHLRDAQILTVHLPQNYEHYHQLHHRPLGRHRHRSIRCCDRSQGDRQIDADTEG